MPTGLPGARLGSPLTGELSSSAPGAIAWPPRISLKYSMGTGLPSTERRKSAGFRPVTRFPCLSTTTASTLTTRTSICSPNELCGAVGAAGFWAAAGARAASVAASARPSVWKLFMEDLPRMKTGPAAKGAQRVLPATTTAR